MATTKPRTHLRIEYEEAAEAYLASLPPEHFMEATPQATQRKITVESFDLIHADRPDVQMFNELLVQYPHGRAQKIRQVVPDNMAVVCAEEIRAVGSYDVPFQPVPPFLAMEYVSKGSKRKDYDVNLRRFERELKVRYYLTFYPDAQELTLYRHNGTKYVSVKPNAQGRLEIPELDLEVGILDGWMRFWYKGQLLPLPADLQRELVETRQQLEAEKRRADQQQARADQQQARADQQQARADQQQARADQQQTRADALERELAELKAQRAAGKKRGGNHS